MDLNWVSAIIATLAVGSTLTLALLNRHDSIAREKLQRSREDAKEDAAQTHAQRALERDSVLKLSGIFANVRRLADRDPDDDPPGSEWDEAFPDSWNEHYYTAMQESELVSGQTFRDVFQECTQAILWCGGLARVPNALSGRQIARDTAALGFVVAGFWLREEEIGPDSQSRIRQLRKLLKDADEMWEARRLRSPGDEL
jgi:hypothetical protein